MLRPPPTSTLFPYTTLFRSSSTGLTTLIPESILENGGEEAKKLLATPEGVERAMKAMHASHEIRRGRTDRKSTRLNSSHGYISYAVFCLKKKNKKKTISSTH